jgi:drug/metabolite transporter (DMT)-like permease
MWLILALFSSFLWGIVHVLDEHCVDRLFSKPWLGVTTSSIVSAGIFLFVPLLGRVELPRLEMVLVCLMTGAIIQSSQYFYFLALDRSDSGTVSAYWNLTPAFLPVISYWLFGYLITGNNYVGIILLLLGSIGLCLADRTGSRWDTMYLMTIAASLQTIVVLLEKFIFDRTDFLGGFLAITFGICVSGLVSLLKSSVRTALIHDLPQLKTAAPIIIAIELINWAALYAGQNAVKLGIPSLVSAIEASIPAFAFAISLGIDFLTRRFQKHQKLPFKLSTIGLMMLGVWFISSSTIY